MDSFLIAASCGLVCAVLVILEHVSMPQWYPEGWGILATHSLGTLTLCLGLVLWGGLIGQLPAVAGVLVVATAASLGTVAGAIALVKPRIAPRILEGYMAVPLYCGGTLALLAVPWITQALGLLAPLALAWTLLVCVGGLGTLTAYGVRWHGDRAGRRRTRVIFHPEEKERPS